MKVRMDSADYLQYQNRLQPQVKVPVQKSPKQQIQNTQNVQLQQNVLSRLQKERVLGDALSVAQMSQSLIQKAIVASSQLRSIATQAFSEGRVDNNAIQQVVADIDQSLQQYGEKVTLPVTSNVQTEGIPNPLVEMNSLKEYSQVIGPGKDLQPLDNIQSHLNEKRGSVENIIKKISSDMSAAAPGVSDTVNKGYVNTIAKNVINNPGEYLGVQGNLNKEIIGQLL